MVYTVHRLATPSLALYKPPLNLVLGGMKIGEPNKYALRLKHSNGYEVVLAGTIRPNFHAPDTRDCPKLYVISEGQDIHYVGVTNQPMSNRINNGLKASGIKGYHGYKWRKLKGTLNLRVWSFKRAMNPCFRKQIETIEAEFAYLVRSELGNWPLSQNEIHFHQSNNDHRTAAKKMLKQCISR